MIDEDNNNLGVAEGGGRVERGAEIADIFEEASRDVGADLLEVACDHRVIERTWMGALGREGEDRQ